MPNNVRIGTQVTGVGKASSDLDNLKDKFSKLQGQGAKGFAIGAGAAITSGAIGLLGQAVSGAAGAIEGAIQDASNLNETISKSGVVFGTSAGQVKTWGEGAARSMGLSENAAIGAAASIGNLLLSTGTAKAKIAPMSEGIVQLASDLASFNNIPMDEALAKLQSGLVGQERPLRELGVAISAASVDAEAANLGFKKVNGTFSEGEKVQARYALIFKQTGTAQGDFARTSDQLANSQRIVNAEMEDASAKIGTQLTPAVTSLENFIATKFIPTAMDTVSVLGNVLTVGLTPMARGLDMVDGAVTATIVNGINLNNWLGSLDVPWHQAAAAAIYTGATTESVSGKMRDDLRATALTTEKATGKMTDDLGAVRPSIISVGNTAHTMGQRVDEGMRLAARATDLYKNRSIADANELIGKAMDPIIEHDQLMIDMADRTAQRKILASSKSTAVEIRNAKLGLDTVDKAIIGEQLDLLKIGQLSAGQQADLIKNLTAKIKTSTGDAHTYFQGVLNDIAQIKSNGKSVPVNIVVKTSKGPQHPLRAAGGPIAPGEVYTVGEQGPELFVSDKAGKILPHGTSPAPTGGGSTSGGGSMGGPTSISLQVVVNPAPGMGPGQARAFGDATGPAIVAFLQRNGFLPRTGTGLTG